MCTVTLIPVARDSDSGVWTHLRLACNRDELRIRPAALPPEIRRCGSRTAIMPVDPLSDGSWIAVNDAGLAATLLNVNPQAPPGPAQPMLRNSRGILVPGLMACTTLDEVERCAGVIDAAEFPPFRLIVLTRAELLDCRSDGRTLQRQRIELTDRPLLFTSSGLGDHLVEQPRRALFESMFELKSDDEDLDAGQRNTRWRAQRSETALPLPHGRGSVKCADRPHDRGPDKPHNAASQADWPAARADWPAAQARFHRHSWPDRRHVSVCMEREEARTVSHTIVDLAPGTSTLTYYGDAPDRAVRPVALSLPLAEAVA